MGLEMSKHPGVVNSNQPSSSAPNQDMHENNMNKGQHSTSACEKLKSISESTLQARTLQVADNKFESPDASPENTSFLHSLGRSTVLGSGNVNLQSLFEIEELNDKELEEAQEHRRICEVEERNALKAYRKAQRALDEANARCTYLYRRRELYSAQLRSFMMEDTSLLRSSRQLRQIGETWNLSNNGSEVDLEVIPTSSHQLQAEFEAGHQLGYDSNVLSADGDAHNRLSANEDGHNLGASEACSEPDASTSEALVRRSSSPANGVRSPSDDRNSLPGDEDETFPLDHTSVHVNVTCLRKEDNTKEIERDMDESKENNTKEIERDMNESKEDDTKEIERDMDVDSTTDFSTEGSRDPLLLEAYLRSKLVSRLGLIGSSKRSGIGENSESAAERVAEEDVTGSKPRMTVDSVSVSDPEVPSPLRGEGHSVPECGVSKSLSNIQNQQHVEEHSLNGSPITSFDPETSGFHFVDIASTSIIPSSSIFRSAMKAACPVCFDAMQNTGQHCGSPDVCNDDNLLATRTNDNLSLGKVSSAEDVKCESFGKIDSYTCKSAINPLWPLCMYELRGICNNNECPWQHLNDCSSRNVSHDNSQIADCRTRSSVLTPPKYLVFLDSLKAESHPYGSLQARYFGSSRKNIFTNSLAVSSSVLKYLPSDEPYLHGNDGCVESYGGGGLSLYFQSRNAAGNPRKNGMVDDDSSLETALLILNQDPNRLEGMKRALFTISRALEADPASLHLWIVYLLLYYSTKNSVGELSRKSTVGQDDFFSYAVKHNERSYELWLLYINSRRQLNERFDAYERALSRLCHHAFTNDGLAAHLSASILDLFLQMLYCFCVSGNVAKAVQIIYKLVHTDGDSDDSYSLLVSDILQCLMISDKSIFWVCCVYLVVYRKLPDEVVQQFEFEKDISVIEWPSVHLTLEEKEQVSKLMKMATDSIGLHVDSGSHESSALKSAHLFALNHIKLMAVMDDEKSCKMLVEKYKISYPTCFELILLSARTRSYITENAKFDGYEEVLYNWPKEVPGIQCIWNQYAEYALENGKVDWAKKIINRWFLNSHFFLNRSIDGDNKSSAVDLNALPSNSNNTDLVFGLLNLSLYRLFQNSVPEAILAIDKALKVAKLETLRHCIREHAVFMFKHGFLLRKYSPLGQLLDILKGYFVHAQSFPTSEALTRRFIQDIRRPRTRQLVTSILSPISPDSFLVNSVLDIWFGSSLLPQNSDEVKEIVDFVEAILEVWPANHQLVISACKIICRDSDDSDTKSPSVLFWASSLLVNTIYRAIPVPPEYAWVDATELLGILTNVREILESFHQRALSVYPFSVKLWKSFLNLSLEPSKRSYVMEAARERGVELD